MDIQIEGIDILIGKLSNLDKKVRTKTIRRAIRASAAPVQKAMKRKAPKDTGGLKKSIKTKTKTYKDGTTVAIIGPDKDFLTTDSRGRKYRPANIAHIVERGSSKVAAQPFIAPAFQEQRDTALGIIATKLREDISNA
jgi:HK97 gp10 family phage protein